MAWQANAEACKHIAISSTDIATHLIYARAKRRLKHRKSFHQRPNKQKRATTIRESLKKYLAKSKVLSLLDTNSLNPDVKANSSLYGFIHSDRDHNPNNNASSILPTWNRSYQCNTTWKTYEQHPTTPESTRNSMRASKRRNMLLLFASTFSISNTKRNMAPIHMGLNSKLWKNLKANHTNTHSIFRRQHRKVIGRKHFRHRYRLWPF